MEKSFKKIYLASKEAQEDLEGIKTQSQQGVDKVVAAMKEDNANIKLNNALVQTNYFGSVESSNVDWKVFLITSDTVDRTNIASLKAVKAADAGSTNSYDLVQQYRAILGEEEEEEEEETSVISV